MADFNNYSALNEHDSMLYDHTMDSESELNQAMLMTSVDNLGETSAEPKDHSILAKSYDNTYTLKSLADVTESNSHIVSQCEEKDYVNMERTFKDFATNDLEHSNIWPALTVLEHSLSDSADNANKRNCEIIEKLYEWYNYSPSNFTEHLITILEGSFTEFSEEMTDSMDSDIPMSSSNSVRYDRPVEEESTPQSFYLLPNENTECIDSSAASSMTVDSLNIKNNTSINNSMLFSSYKRIRESNKRTITFSADPKILVNEKECIISKIKPVQFSIKKAKSTQRRNSFRKTPKICVQPATPNMKKTLNANCKSLRMSNEDDDYTTTDSENNEGTMMVEESETSINESVNMSKVAVYHKEWVNAYEKLARYKPVNRTDTSITLDRQWKISNHTKKPERRWLQELSKKRQKCFEVVDKCRQNVENDSIESNKDTNLSYSHQNMKFYKTLKAVSDYLAFAMTSRESFKSEARAKRNHRSSRKSPTNMVKKNASSLQGTSSLTKKISGKSLATKVTPLKSPRAKKQQTEVTPKIDRTSIQPVNVLRMVYSPKSRIPNKVYSTETKIPLPKQVFWKSYLTDPLRKRATTKAATETVGVGGFRSTTKFKNVKSPIREYIRGEK